VNRNVLTRRALAGIAVAALALTGCGSNGGSGNAGEDGGEALSGEVLVDGSSTVGPLTIAASTLYTEDNGSSVRVPVAVSGTGGGFKKFCAGETDISNASRPIKQEEIDECEANNIEYVGLHMANDALAVVVNPQNDFVECLTVDQLKAIWEPGSTVNNWNQVDPSFPDMKLELSGPGADSGTFDYFTEVINGKSAESRDDFLQSEDDNIIVEHIAGTAGGLGYFGYTYVEENPGKVKAIKIDGGNGCVEPSIPTAQDGSYAPLARPLYVYVSDAGMHKPQVVHFMDYYIENLDDITAEAQFVGLTDAQKTELQTSYDELKSSL
jgi:phosphate transport system substrate-binding protein